MIQKPQWEIDHGITADRFEDHHGYYLQKAKLFGIGWPRTEERFMNRTREHWAELYDQDEHLNNARLSEFDRYHFWDLAIARRLRVPISKACSVCMRKAVIKEEVLKWRRRYLEKGA